jgi:hypothetical protein
MLTLLLLLALVLLLVYAGWLWTAPRVPGVRAAGPVELLMSLAVGVLVAACWRRGAAGCGDHGTLSRCGDAVGAFYCSLSVSPAASPRTPQRGRPSP